jgi:NAD+ synthase
MVRIPTNTKLLREILTAFIRNEVHKTGLTRGLVGLSGGVDSAVTAVLAAAALGAANVLAVLMPYKSSHPDSQAHAELVVEQSGIASLSVDITPQIDSYFERFPDADARRRGNKMARERMTILYDLSARWNGLVLGTSNKTELLLGYGTLYGDMACAFAPIGDLYKSQLRDVARHLGVPERILAKPPSADLWPGQTDETELGFTYDAVDRILYALVDRRWTVDRCVAAGLDRRLVEAVARRVALMEFKRQTPPVAKVSLRTPGIDHLYPRRRPGSRRS